MDNTKKIGHWGLSYGACTLVCARYCSSQRRFSSWKMVYSKASIYTTSSCTDLDNAHFLNRDQKILRCTNLCSENLKLHGFFFDDLAFALLSINSRCMNFELYKFFHSPQNVHLKALLYFKINLSESLAHNFIKNWK